MNEWMKFCLMNMDKNLMNEKLNFHGTKFIHES